MDLLLKEEHHQVRETARRFAMIKAHGPDPQDNVQVTGRGEDGNAGGGMFENASGLEGLGNFPDDSFDMVVMTETLQSVRDPNHMLDEMLRIGHRGEAVEAAGRPRSEA